MSIRNFRRRISYWRSFIMRMARFFAGPGGAEFGCNIRSFRYEFSAFPGAVFGRLSLRVV